MATWTLVQEFDFLIAIVVIKVLEFHPFFIFYIMPVIKYKLISVIIDSFQQRPS